MAYTQMYTFPLHTVYNYFFFTAPVTESQNEQWKDNLEAKGVVFVDRANRRFSDIMEDKAKKQGLSWRNPGPSKIKLVKREKPLKDVVLYVTKKLEHLAGIVQGVQDQSFRFQMAMSQKRRLSDS